MAWTELAKQLNLTAKATEERWNKVGLDGDEAASLAAVFELAVNVPPDGRVSEAKIQSGLAKLKASPKKPPTKKVAKK